MNIDNKHSKVLWENEEELILRVTEFGTDSKASKDEKLTRSSLVKGGLKLQRKHFYIFILIICLIFIGFHKLQDYLNGTANKMGNSISNLETGGFAAAQGDTLYFSTGSGVFRMQFQDKNPEKITEGNFTKLNVIGNWIYCNDEKGRIAKISTDGKEITYLLDQKENQIIEAVTKDGVYYSNKSGTLFRVKLDGRDETVIAENGLVLLNINENNIFTALATNKDVSKGTARFRIYKQGINSKDYDVIFDETAVSSYIYADERYVYYLKSSRNNFNVLVRFDILKNTRTEMLLDNFRQFCISDNIIYYVNFDGMLFRYDLKGENLNRLTSGLEGGFNVIGDWIMYRYNGNLCMIKNDGKDFKVLENLKE